MGEVRNEGYDSRSLSMYWRSEKFNWNLSGSFSHNKETLVRELAEGFKNSLKIL